SDIDQGHVRFGADDRVDAADAVPDRMHLVSEALEAEAQQLADVGVVFDDDDLPRLGRQLRLAGSVLLRRYRGRRRREREVNGETAPLTQAVALGLDRAAVQLDEIAD